MLKKAGHDEERWEILQLNTDIYNVIAQHIELVVDPAYCRLGYKQKIDALQALDVPCWVAGITTCAVGLVADVIVTAELFCL